LLGASRNVKAQTVVVGTVDFQSPLIRHFSSSKDPLVLEEVKQLVEDYKDLKLIEVEKQLLNLYAAVVIPSFVEEKLLGILVLGKKKSGKLFSQDDLVVFSVLANQAALAIENAQFYEDMKRTQEQLFQAEKMATIGTMADGLSHQINNRLHALGFIAGDALDTIKIKNSASLPTDMKEWVDDIENALKRIQENVKQGGEIVQGLLRYTRKGDQGFSPVDLDQLVTASVEMAQYKVKLNQIEISREYPKDIPKIKGNFTQLQEVFFNLIDNAYDAMMQRKTEENEPGYSPVLKISASQENGQININVADNGIGVKKENNEKLFTPFFTTKRSSRKGTGLGLYVIQKIIEENHGGKVHFSSQYKQGTQFTIQLPIIS
jgi:signal transduction histidine kinase